MANAEVTITGTAEKPVLNFKIPKGDKGDTGAASTVPGPRGNEGPRGPQGESGVSGIELNGLPQVVHDLNDYIQTNNYIQTTNAGAAIGKNYPNNSAGMLEVRGASVSIYQTYRTYNNISISYRTRYNGTWNAWKTIVL